MKAHRSIGLMALWLAGCVALPAPSPFAAKRDVLGEWGYRVIRLEQREGLWVDATASNPVSVEAEVSEAFITFLDVNDRQPVQRFRITEHVTIDGGVVVSDMRPWTDRNGLVVDWSEGLIAPTLLMDRGQSVESAPWSGIEGIRSELPSRDAMGEAYRWSMPGLYEVRICDGSDPACVVPVFVRHELTR